MSPHLPHPSPFLRLAILASLAAATGYLAGELLPIIAPVPAAVTAVITTQATASQAWRTGVIQVLGIIIGSLVALLAIQAFGYGALAIFLMVFTSYGLVIALKRFKGISAPEAAASIAVSVIIVVGSHLSTTDTFDRFLGVIVGALIGLVASTLAVTRSGIDEVDDEIADLFASVGVLVGDISENLTHASVATVNTWIQRAEAIRAEWRTVNTALTEIETTSKWSPLVSQQQAKAVRRRLDSLGMSITRLAVITSDLKTAAKADLFVDSPKLAGPLAQLFEEVAATLDPDTNSGSRSEVNRHARNAMEQASDGNTEEFVMLSSLAQNARKLLPPVETGILPAATDEDRHGVT